VQDKLAAANATADAALISQYEAPALTMWAEVPGSKVRD
jgi:hypothetical protein